MTNGDDEEEHEVVSIRLSEDENKESLNNIASRQSKTKLLKFIDEVKSRLQGVKNKVQELKQEGR